jgi:hypothetical protein
MERIHGRCHKPRWFLQSSLIIFFRAFASLREYDFPGLIRGNQRNSRRFFLSSSSRSSHTFIRSLTTFICIAAKCFYISGMRQILVTITLALIFIAGIWLGFKLTLFTKAGAALREENTATVVQQVQTLGDLVTVKYVMERVVILNSPPASMMGQLFAGENRLMLLAHGTVKAGIDLKQIQPADVVVDGKKITIHLPVPRITDAYLDETQTKVIDWQRGFLRDFDKDLESAARQNAVDDLRRAARANGILKDADERARMQLAQLFHQAGYDQIEFVSQTPVKPSLSLPRENAP